MMCCFTHSTSLCRNPQVEKGAKQKAKQKAKAQGGGGVEAAAAAEAPRQVRSGGGQLGCTCQCVLQTMRMPAGPDEHFLIFGTPRPSTTLPCHFPTRSGTNYIGLRSLCTFSPHLNTVPCSLHFLLAVERLQRAL